MKLIDKAIIAALTLLFIFAGIDKIFHFSGFVNALRNYVLVPSGTAGFLAVPVIAMEIFIGVGLLLKPWRRPAALAAAVMLVIFTVALWLNHTYGDRGVCGCWFTLTLAEGTNSHIAQNLLMAFLALSIWWEEPDAPVAAQEALA